MRRITLPLLVLLVWVPTTLAAKIKTTEDLVQAMQKKYAKSWYKTATFVQKTTNIDKEVTRKLKPGMNRFPFQDHFESISHRRKTATAFCSRVVKSMYSRMERSIRPSLTFIR